MRIKIKFLPWFGLVVIILLFASCDTPTILPSDTPTTETASLPTTTSTTTATQTRLPPTSTPIPDPEETTRAYLDSWKMDDYQSMYSKLTTISKDAITGDAFTERYRRALSEAAVSTVEYEILSSFVRNNSSAEVSYRIHLDSVLVGDIQRDTVMNLSLETDGWRVQWSDELILPELADGNYLWMDRHIPTRANIYDRNEEAIAAYAEAVSVAIIPGQFAPGTEEELLTNLQAITGLHPDAIYYQYYDYPPGAEWLVYLGEFPQANVERYYNVTNGYNFNGLLMYPFESRFYFKNGIAPQTVGYVSYIQVEEEEEYLQKGYSRDEKVGRQGIEKWGDEYLGGIRGGTLYVIGPDDQVVT